MTKLTKELRNEIVQNAQKSLFQKEFDDLKTRKQVFGDKLFSKHIAKPEQYALMEKLPAEFFHRRGVVSVDFKDGNHRQEVLLSSTRRIPAFAYYSVEINDSAMAKEWEKLDKEEESLYDQRGELVDEIRKVVLSVTTIEKLLSIWPECKPFIPAHAFLEGGTKNVPAILVANLTAKLIQAGAKLNIENAEKVNA